MFRPGNGWPVKYGSLKMTYRTDTVIIGAGQAGLAVGRCLADAGIDHVIIDRGRVGERWRSERWRSLRLLTPNWMTRLPGFAYDGSDPDGFMPRRDVVHFLEAYQSSFQSPVFAYTAVDEVARAGQGYLITTDRGQILARCVVVATGACDRPHIPAFAQDIPASIRQIAPSDYRSPQDLPEGGVLIVGASATGVQLAEEIHISGRPVTIAVGRHARMPRTYRGRDIMAWLDDTGFLTEPRPLDVEATRLSQQPSLQLVGDSSRHCLDLPALEKLGVRIVGRALGVNGSRLALGADLDAACAGAERRRQKILAFIDNHIADAGLNVPRDPSAWSNPGISSPDRPDINLEAEGIRSVMWATGYRRAYPWLRVPVLDSTGEICNVHGVTASRGLYVLGLPFMTHRASTFIDGVGRDASIIATHIAADLGHTLRAAA